MLKINWQDYFELCKPRVVALMLLTAIVGMQLATPNWIPWHIFVCSILGIALVAGAAAAINHLVDYRIDMLMARTQRRPLPKGKITPRNTLIFALSLAILGTLILLIFVNALTAVLTLLSLIGYAVIYTMYLKRATSQNIVIGGIAGATPPLLGWTAITNQLDPYGLLLALIIFVWTPAHFWSLAIHRYEDYAKANIPMLPITHGIAFTKRSIVLYVLLLFAASLMPFACGMTGIFYLIAAILLNSSFLYQSVVLLKDASNKTAIKNFHCSNIYLMSLFVVLLIDHYLKNSL